MPRSMRLVMPSPASPTTTAVTLGQGHAPRAQAMSIPLDNDIQGEVAP